MANQTAGINVQDDNPYNITVTNSGTLVGSDVELVVNLSTVKTRNQLVRCIENLLDFVLTDSFTGYGPSA